MQKSSKHQTNPMSTHSVHAGHLADQERHSAKLDGGIVGHHLEKRRRKSRKKKVSHYHHCKLAPLSSYQPNCSTCRGRANTKKERKAGNSNFHYAGKIRIFTPLSAKTTNVAVTRGMFATHL